jgi:exodeoxyribonuclease VII large subunit
VGRGGGSIEDLWAFNEEKVARAIFRANTPIVSAVGHETDFSISDMVADARAATPSEAAELVVPDREKYTDIMDNVDLRISAALRRRMEDAEQMLDMAGERLRRCVGEILRERWERLTHLEEMLKKRDPMAPLEKGFAMGLYAGNVYDANRLYVCTSDEAVRWGLKLFNHFYSRSTVVKDHP